MSNHTTVSGGIGFTGLLTIVFVAAKLWGKINWAWIWVFAPIWGVWGIVLGVVALCLLFVGVAWVFGAIAEIPRRRRRALEKNGRASPYPFRRFTDKEGKIIL